MTEWNGRRKHAPASGIRALAATMLAASLVTACGGGGGGSGDTHPVPPPVGITNLSVDTSSTVAGSGPIPLHATVEGTTQALDWRLDGPGKLVPDGTGMDYVPPGQEFLDEPTTVTVRASVVGTWKSVQVALTPVAKVGHRWTTSRPAASQWRTIAAGGGMFLAPDDATKQVYRSVDGRTWTPQALPSTSALFSVAWGDAGWVGIDASMRIITSPDGLTWTDSGPAPAYGMQIVYGNGRYVMATGLGIMDNDQVSLNGIDWSPGGAQPLALAFGAGLFAGITSRGIETSTDGLTWSLVPGMPTDLKAIAYGNGQFMATGEDVVVRSVDGGRNWSLSVPNGISLGQDNLSFADGLFFQGGLDGTQVSSDGLAWTFQPAPEGWQGTVALAEHDGIVVGVTRGGALLAGSDAMQLDEVIEASIGNLMAVDYKDGLYVAVSDQGWSVSSTDTQRWTRWHIGAHDITRGDFFARSLAHGNGVLVAVGTLNMDNGQGMAAVSADGAQWTQVTIPGETDTPVGISFDGNHFVVVDDHGGVYASDSGYVWSQIASIGGVSPRAITFGGGRFVVVGDGAIATSTDAVHWNTVPQLHLPDNGLDKLLAFNAVTWDGQRYVAVGDGSATSPDAQSWTAHATQTSLSGVAEGDGVIVGSSSSVELYTSADGAEWRQRELSTTMGHIHHAVVHSGGRFVSVGDGGEIIVSGP